MTKGFIALLLALLLCLSGCAPTAEAPQPTPAPTPEPTPALMGGEALCDAFALLWEHAGSPSIGEYLPENMFAAEDRWSIYGTEYEDRIWLPAMAEELETQFVQLLTDTADKLAEDSLAPAFTYKTQVTAPLWQLVLSLLQASSSAEQAEEYIKSAMSLSTHAEQQADGSYLLTAELSPLPYKKALELPSGANGVMRYGFAYSYALTVFAEDASEYKEYIQPPAEGNLASGIVWPLGEHTRLRKTWYADRDGGRRKHTGTDIWAPADAELYSCTDGTVTYIGYSDGTGYAVVVTDEFGYEFHYYHMIRQTDFLKVGDTVQAGQLIGHVGNTGNSDLDHLHLTIIASDGLYINPYPYLKAIEP